MKHNQQNKILYVVTCLYVMAWLLYFPTAFWLDAEFIDGNWLISTFPEIAYVPAILMLAFITVLHLTYHFSRLAMTIAVILSFVQPLIYFAVIGYGFRHV